MKIIPVCPGCKTQVTALDFEPLEATQRSVFNAPEPLQAIAYLCPHCKAILGVGSDPRSS